MKNYLLIGDIHSQGSDLALVLKYAKANNCTPIFLGDLFDSRCDNSETIYVWNQVKVAQSELGAIVLNSNHQERLLSHLKGHPDSPSIASETWRTHAEFEEAGVDLNELKTWLGGLPDGFVFRDCEGVQYGCSHAYFPSRYLHSDTKEDYAVFAASEHDKQSMAWGPYDHRHRRIKWWKDAYDPTWIRCAGHYHVVHLDQKSIVLDANSGFHDGKIPAYNVNAKELVYFSVSESQSTKATEV